MMRPVMAATGLSSQWWTRATIRNAHAFFRTHSRARVRPALGKLICLLTMLIRDSTLPEAPSEAPSVRGQREISSGILGDRPNHALEQTLTSRLLLMIQ
jgi:hypothetical protein